MFTTRSRRVTAALATGVVLSVVAACGGGDDGGATGEAGTDEPLQFFLSGDANQGGGFAAMAEKYEEETGVTVEIVDIANADLPTKLKNAAQANDLPALARVGGVDPVWGDLTVDLSPILEGSDINAELAAVDPDGKVLSLPTDVTAVGLFINKTLFDEAGVAYPTTADDIWTWDEYVAAVKEVQAATGTTYGMVMDRSSHRLKSFLFEFGSEYFQANEDGEFETDEEMKVALEYFKSLNDDSFMPRSVWLSDADGNALFKSGDVVSYYSGSWQIADFAVNIADFEWAPVRLPMQPVRAANYGNAANVVVFEGDQQDAAVDFVEWMYEPENYRELAETSSFLPAIEGLEVTYATDPEAFELYNEEIAASDPIVKEIKRRDLAYEVAGLATDGDPVRDEVVKYLNDEQDVDTTIDNINAQLTDQLGALPE
ncbi:extracellular solute-binding protein [Cellulomonas sp. ATA003]|uniref:ABC transporter substrate-binding protein n=1 Tax=Cellulomonas sp. ATA003 TaxID=3073064 RepID=UPI0028733BE4|nr:extracellular solute-binding protein [Cellulomonas sp. ATA003]WNB87080.1 extracellular solute-binding protein [Cellulomonas sp. ATA003]